MKRLSIFPLVVVLIFMSACGSDGSGTHSDPLDPLSVYNLPPDPGEAGKATLVGIDSDDDGVRDDVQIAIYERYPDPVDAPKREALLLSTKKMTESTLIGDSGDANRAFNFQNNQTFIRCIHNTFENSSDEILFLELSIFNTDSRNSADEAFSDLISGNIFSSKSSVDACKE